MLGAALNNYQTPQESVGLRSLPGVVHLSYIDLDISPIFSRRTEFSFKVSGIAMDPRSAMTREVKRRPSISSLRTGCRLAP